MHNAVVLDGYTLNPGDLDWHPLESLVNTTIFDRTSYNSDEASISLIVSRAKDADIVFTNKTPLSRKAISQLPKLKYIGMLATGYDVVDIEAAREHGVVVTNIPTYGTDAVSQMAIALLLEVCHHVGAHDKAVKSGGWENNQDWSYWEYPLIELAGKNIGIIGYGRIGQSTGRIAQALNMKVIAYDYYKNSDLESESMKYAELEELYHDSDVIALHCPLTNDNRGFINKESISKMKDGVIIINNSRGPLINENDLAEALNYGKVGAAAVDVVSSEPIKGDNPLLSAKNCIITPHISWATKEARQRLFLSAIENLREFLRGNPVNVVNK